MQQQNGPHLQRQPPSASASYPPPLLPSSQQPQGVQPYSSTSGILPDLLSWHMSQSLQPWSIQATAPTGSFFTFPATPPQFIPSNTYSSPYTFAPFPAIASHFPIGTLPALSTVPTAINLPYTGVAAVPQVPQVPNYVGAIRSSMGEAAAAGDVQPHEQAGGDISVIPITRDIFLVGAHHNNSANYSSNSNNREEVAVASNRRVEQFHHRQQQPQDVPSPPSSSPERSDDLSSPSSLASILMNSPSPLSTSPSIPVLSPSRSRTPSPHSSVANGNASSRYCPNNSGSSDVSPLGEDRSTQPGPSSRPADQLPAHGTYAYGRLCTVYPWCVVWCVQCTPRCVVYIVLRSTTPSV